MNLKQFQNVYANTNAPSAARIISAIVLLGAALGELFTGLFYIGMIALGVCAVVAAIFGQYDLVGGLPEWLRGLLLGIAMLILFVERLSSWAFIAAARTEAAKKANAK